MSFLLGRRRQAPERRAALGRVSFGWGAGHADFSATALIPPPGLVPSLSAEAALQKVAIWSCVDLTASAAEMLPLDIYDGRAEVGHEVPVPEWLSDLSGDGYGIHDWIWQLIYSGMLRGNAFAPIRERDPRTGQPRRLTLVHPDDVRRTPDGMWVLGDGQEEIAPSDLWHRRHYPVPGAPVGLSPIQVHMMTLGVSLGALQTGLSYMQSAAMPSSLLTTDALLSKEQADEAKRRWIATQGGKREPAVLGGGWKWTQVSISPEESQFLETNKYTAAECCRIFGPAYAEVLGYDVGNSMTYSNRESRALDLLTFSLDRWLVWVERAITDLLPGNQFAKLDRGALLRTDLLTRYKAHALGISAGFLVPDEARDEEDMPPLTPAQLAQLKDLAPAKAPAMGEDGSGS